MSGASAASRPGLIAYEESNVGLGVVPFGPSGASQFAVGGSSFVGGATVQAPRWAPNGETLAFTDGFHILLASRSGHVLATLLHDASGIQALDWSPNGRRIAYMCGARAVTGEFDGGQICVLNVISGTTTHLTPATNDIYADPRGTVSWSPKGNEIAFSSWLYTPECPYNVTSPPPAGCVVDEAVAVVDVKTGAVQQITPAADFAGDPAFSPNGDEISYFSRAGAHPGLDVMTSFGTYVRQVDDSANVRCDSCGDVESGWSPDGRLLVGGEAKQLTHSGNDLHMPDSSTCSRSARSFRLPIATESGRRW